MDIHEWTYLVRGNKTRLQPGMCFSDEPMIAIYGEFGIRLEDCLYITDSGARYLVSPRGETEWVRNLRAAGEADLGGEQLRATEVPVAERAAILSAYQDVAGRAVASHFEALPDASDHPVFRIEPR